LQTFQGAIMSKPVILSFYRWAMGLAVSEPVRLMHELAREIYRDLGGEAVEEHLAIHAEIVALWRQGGPERPPLREALRCMGARERGHARRDKLREQAWLQARADVFQRTGERIPLPQTPETFEREQTAEEAALVQQLSKQLRKVGAMAQEMEEAELKEAGPSTGSGQGSFSGGGTREGSGSCSPGSMGENVHSPVGSSAAMGTGTFSAQTAARNGARPQRAENEPDPRARNSA
jgi:hypothetical protein